MRYLSAIITLSFAVASLRAQRAELRGKITDEHRGAIPATVSLPELKSGVDCDLDGTYHISGIPAGTFTVRVSSLGYASESRRITFEEGVAQTFNARLKEADQQLTQVVVTGSRERINRKRSPVVVEVISAKTLEDVQAVNLAEGLHFQPGLRVETNCQNCGFSQLRMNGLGGAYSQILIDSRPVFSALAGVYGLEQIPASMIDRIEVVSGGGSSLYGANAIAGTVNIITKDPILNGFQTQLNTALLSGEAPDDNLSFYVSEADEDMKVGSLFFGNFRRRSAWDSDGDGYSEIPQVDNNSFGFKSYYKPRKRSELKLEGHFIKEFRRGGNDFEKPPQEAGIAEQLQHDIYGGQLSYETRSKDGSAHYAAYASGQAVDRKSYYGSHQDPNAFGISKGFTGIGGLQWNQKLKGIWGRTASWIKGVEIQYDGLRDESTGYQRRTEQRVWNSGLYTQFDFKPLKALKASMGVRLDAVALKGEYSFRTRPKNTDFKTLQCSPRLNLLYSPSDHLRFRGAYSRGFRAPQAFDEDLHVQSVGGESQFIELSKGLKTERSNSFTASVNWDYSNPSHYVEVLLEGFYTSIKEPFINENLGLREGGLYRLIEKRNGSGSRVLGMNFRVDHSFKGRLQTQVGFTWESALYDKAERVLTKPDGTVIRSREIMRTPDRYGYFTLDFKASKRLGLDLSGTYTGAMIVPYTGGPSGPLGNGEPVLFKSPDFFVLNSKLSYGFALKHELKLKLSAGVKNLFDDYQKNFDSGMDRNSTFIYGPGQPRTFFIGIKIGNLD